MSEKVCCEVRCSLRGEKRFERLTEEGSEAFKAEVHRFESDGEGYLVFHVNL